MNANVVLRMALLARQRFRIPLPLALQLPYRVRVRGGTVGQMYDQSVGLGPLRSSSLLGGRKRTVKDINRLQPGRRRSLSGQPAMMLGRFGIPSERFGIREFLTHGPSPTPDPTRKVKGKGSEPLACEQRHSQDNVSIHLELCSSVLAIMHGV